MCSFERFRITALLLLLFGSIGCVQGAAVSSTSFEARPSVSTPSSPMPSPKEPPSFPANEPPTEQLVTASGRAAIHNGEIDPARRAALRNAYLEAINMASGLEIGSLTLIRNMQLVSDVIVSRSKGFINRYVVIREGVAMPEAGYYEITIEAEVHSRRLSEADQRDGLRLYLDVLNNPMLLVVLPEYPMVVTTSRLRSDDMILTGGEAAIAQVFAGYGYRIMTSDELLADGRVSSEVIASARRGATQDALAASRAAGAELALVGNLRFSESEIQPQGIPLFLVVAEVSAKAVITSSGRNLAVFHQTFRASASDLLSAYTHVLKLAAEGFANALAWKIPTILSTEVRETRLIIHNINIDTAEHIRQALLNHADIEDARLTRLPVKTRPVAELLLMSSFLGIEPGDIIQSCRHVLTEGMDVLHGDRFKIELKSTSTGGSRLDH